MNGQGLFLAWIVGVHCGAAMLVSRTYGVAVAAFLTMVLGSHWLGLTPHWIVTELIVVMAFALLAVGMVRGVAALWRGL